ncbi:MAG: UDP-N-acetylglucosamine-1-phosphate transferase, partial [Nitrosopumilus sp.]
MIELILPAVASCIIAFFVVFLMTPPLIKFLGKRNLAVKDVNKKEDVMVVRPGGPSIIVGIIASEI